MSLSINTNMSALTAHRNMVSNDKAMNTSLTRLSTGLRINSAADDASGLTIADSLAAQADGLGQGIRNASDGISIVQTADGALEESVNIVNTIKTKAIQAASDTQTTSTRSAIQEDIDKLMEELDSIATTTSYNGQQLLNGTYTNKVIQVGASANETVGINIGDAESDSIGHISTATLEISEDEGPAQLIINSAITGEDIMLESIDIKANNEEKNGLGALADEINTVSSLTGVSALAVVETITNEGIQEGTTGSDFAINGINIGSVNVQNNDANSSLVTAINDRTSETGVSAASDTEGTMTLTSEDGRVLNVTGDLGGVFGDNTTTEDLSTIGHITLTQEGSSQFNITSALTGRIAEELTTDAVYKPTDSGTTTIAEGSTIITGSIYTTGTVLGGTTEVDAVADTASDYQLEAGTLLTAGSILSQGTTITTEIETAANATLVEDMTITSGSTLTSGTTLGAGTVLNQTFSNLAGTATYEAGTTLADDLVTDVDLLLTSDMTLKEDSILFAATILTAGSSLGADITTANDVTVGESMTLESGSTIAASSFLATGSTLGDTTTTLDDVVTTTEMDLLTGSQLEAASILSEGSIIGSPISVDNIVTTEDMALSAGSTLLDGTILLQGTTISQDILDTNGTDLYAAGTTLTADTTIGDTILTEELVVKLGSDIAASSILVMGSSSEASDDVQISDQEGMTLSDISVLSQEDAQLAITVAEAALADLDSIRASLGSTENQITSSISNLSVTKTNVTAAESTIRDVDFAEETSNFAKLSLLAQTGSYALSQANASTSNLTSLLQ